MQEEDDQPQSDSVDSPGPLGNPASDEEVLSDRQQEEDAPADD